MFKAGGVSQTLEGGLPGGRGANDRKAARLQPCHAKIPQPVGRPLQVGLGSFFCCCCSKCSFNWFVFVLFQHQSCITCFTSLLDRTSLSYFSARLLAEVSAWSTWRTSTPGKIPLSSLCFRRWSPRVLTVSKESSSTGESTYGADIH